MEIVAELGLMEKVEKVGWSGLSAAESGRVGGLMTQRLRQLR
ncbi:MAG: small, acid-soluble spore protein, alpha/beta type [Clostridia bacterium]|nr:small, acid-soluble spore protein, alpha/beta type [Clostridia bacterium]